MSEVPSRDQGEVVLRLVGADSVDALKGSGLIGPGVDAEEVYRLLAPLREAPGLAIVDARQNGRRIDVRLRSEPGDAWLVVVWAHETTTQGVESVTVYERPRPFDGRAFGLVIVLNGPSSVGKSSLMRAFADAASTPFACLDEPFFGRLPSNFLAWPDTLGPHVQGVLAGLAVAARLGNQFIVSAAGISQQQFRSAFGDVSTVYVGLDAPLDALVRRQLLQADKFGGLAEESIGVHEGWEYDLRIATDHHDPEDAARLLSEHIASLEQSAP